MRKTVISSLAVVTLGLSGCGGMLGTSGSSDGNGLGGVLGGVLGTLGSANTANGLIDMVIGHIKIDQSQLIGTWQYSAPGCAFTSENLLAKAGGAVAAANVKEKLQSAYSAIGISAQNTQFVFAQDGQFSAKVKGIPFGGTYTYEPTTGTLALKTALISTNAYITRTSSGLALTFESKRLLTVLQAAAALSGNSTVQTVGDLSKQFDGVRVGFEMRK